MVIDVIDVNEFDPVFERKIYNFIISTSQIGQMAGSVKVPITTIYLADMYLDNRLFCRLMWASVFVLANWTNETDCFLRAVTCFYYRRWTEAFLQTGQMKPHT